MIRSREIKIEEIGVLGEVRKNLQAKEYVERYPDHPVFRKYRKEFINQFNDTLNVNAKTH